MKTLWSVCVILDEDDHQLFGGPTETPEQLSNLMRLKSAVQPFCDSQSKFSIVHGLRRLEATQCDSQLWSKSPDCIDRLGHLSIVARQIAIQQFLDGESESHRSDGVSPNTLVICSRLGNSEKRTIGIAGIKRANCGGMNSGYMTAVLKIDPGQTDESGQLNQLAETIMDFLTQMNGAKNSTFVSSGISHSVCSEQFIYSECDASIAHLMVSSKLAFMPVKIGSSVTCDNKIDFVGKAVLPGSFHPLHHGHLDMAAAAEEILGCEVSFELSVVNADKPRLDVLEINQRAHQDFAGRDLLLTNAGRFVDKARIFENRTFIVGVDTICRIGDPRFYENSDSKMQTAVQTIVSLGCRFLVFGRKSGDAFVDAQSVNIPHPLAEICTCVDENKFRADVSSSELRRRLSQGFWEPEW